MIFRPLAGWPRPFTTRRRPSPFDVGYTRTVATLHDEAKHLGAGVVVCQLAITDADLRRDGAPRAHAKPEHPGVIVALPETRYGPQSYPCDAFDHWHANLRAIALALGDLRRVARYGVADTGQQYRGWMALGTGEPETVGRDTGDAVRGLRLRMAAGGMREAVKRHHPDNGGAEQDWHDLQAYRATPRGSSDA